MMSLQQQQHKRQQHKRVRKSGSRSRYISMQKSNKGPEDGSRMVVGVAHTKLGCGLGTQAPTKLQNS
jgi:hypothetical protein